MSNYYEKLGELPVKEVSMSRLTDYYNALIIVDMLKGFCHTGSLQSPHNDALKQPIANLVAKFQGPILSVQDAHEQNDKEFQAFPPHCQKDSEESELVKPIAEALKNHQNWDILYKRTLSPFFGADDYSDWLHKCLVNGIKNFNVVGNCTDLCVHQTALSTDMWLAEQNSNASVSVITNLVNTYDMPIKSTPEGAIPHPRDLYHTVFLHHMALNGVRLLKIEN